MTRVAAVDLGTNSTRLLVADVEEGRLTELARRLTVTRLGSGVDEERRLDPASAERVHEVLTRYRAEAGRLDVERWLATATSWARDAEDAHAFLAEVTARHGIPTRALSGREEAELTFAGVASGRDVAPGTLVVDIGGGSTELVLGGPSGVTAATSLDVGSVRLTERQLHDDPPTREQLDLARAEAHRLLPPLAPDATIGVAGTVTTLAALDLGLAEEDPAQVDGHRLTRDAVDRQLDRLAGMPLAERNRVPGIPSGRAAVILGGIVVLRAVMDAYDLDLVEVSARDLLHGTALIAAGERPFS